MHDAPLTRNERVKRKPFCHSSLFMNLITSTKEINLQTLGQRMRNISWIALQRGIKCTFVSLSITVFLCGGKKLSYKLVSAGRVVRLLEYSRAVSANRTHTAVTSLYYLINCPTAITSKYSRVVTHSQIMIDALSFYFLNKIKCF